MINRTTVSTGGSSYIDIRIGGGGAEIHEQILDAAALAASRDADGMLPPGLPVSATGGIVAAGDATGIVGPEPVKLGSVNILGNVIFQGVLNRDAIEDNLSRVLSAAELAGIGTGLKAVTLR